MVILWLTPFSYLGRFTYKSRWGSNSKIAILYITGNINTGDSQSSGLVNPKSVGDNTILKAIKQIKSNPFIEGVGNKN